MGDDKIEQAERKPGAIWYYSRDGVADTGLLFSCPCGCKTICGIKLKPPTDHWRNTGTREKPNITPDIRIGPWSKDEPVEQDGSHWHGFLKNGVWKSC